MRKTGYDGRILLGITSLKNAFTLAEMMVVLLILSIILAAFAPVMTTRSKAIKAGGGTSEPGGDIWKYASGNAQIYYDENGATNMAMIGQKTVGTGENARLILNTSDPASPTSNTQFQNQILFKRNGTLSGYLRADNMGNILLASTNAPATDSAESVSNNYNTALGAGALQSMMFYNGNGMSYGYSRTNTGIGYKALYKTFWGIGNVAIGNRALSLAEYGYIGQASGQPASNTAVGNEALGKAYGTSGNTAMGNWALQNYYVGAENTAIGAGAMRYSYWSSSNVAVGNAALLSEYAPQNTHIYGNTALGSGSCRLVAGSNKTCLGAASGPSVTTGDAAGDNYVAWINTGTASKTIIAGSALINGTTNVTSDGRLKNIKGENKDGLEKIKQLKVHNYTRKDDDKKTPRVGVIAQELKKIFPNAVSDGNDGYLAIRTDDILYAIVNAVKEIDAKISELFNKYIDQEARIKSLESKNKELEQRIKKLEEKLN